jgi:hypothetical protein
MDWERRSNPGLEPAAPTLRLRGPAQAERTTIAFIIRPPVSANFARPPPH